jgi:hypothetical protein
MNVWFIYEHRNQIFGNKIWEVPCSGTVKAVATLVECLTEHGIRVFLNGPNAEQIETPPNCEFVPDIACAVTRIEASKDENVVIGVSYAAHVFCQHHFRGAKRIWWWHNTYTSNAPDLLRAVREGKIDLVIPVAHNILALNLGLILRSLGLNKTLKFMFNNTSVVNNSLCSPIGKAECRDAGPKKLVYIGNYGVDSGFFDFINLLKTFPAPFLDEVEVVTFGGPLHSDNSLNIGVPESFNDMGLLPFAELKHYLRSHNSIVFCGLSGLESASYGFQEAVAYAAHVVTRMRGGQFELYAKGLNDNVTVLPIWLLKTKFGYYYLKVRLNRPKNSTVEDFFRRQRHLHDTRWLEACSARAMKSQVRTRLFWLLFHRCSQLFD